MLNVAAIERFGGPKELWLHTLPVPIPAAKKVLSALHSSGVAGWDADMRQGWFPSGRPHFPFVLRTDGTGVVVETDSRVRRFGATAFTEPLEAWERACAICEVAWGLGISDRGLRLASHWCDAWARTKL
jgi:NADPH:quinone reductase-like Zn-dependent oxidoreductase